MSSLVPGEQTDVSEAVFEQMNRDLPERGAAVADQHAPNPTAQLDLAEAESMAPIPDTAESIPALRSHRPSISQHRPSSTSRQRNGETGGSDAVVAVSADEIAALRAEHVAVQMVPEEPNVPFTPSTYGAGQVLAGASDPSSPSNAYYALASPTTTHVNPSTHAPHTTAASTTNTTAPAPAADSTAVTPAGPTIDGVETAETPVQLLSIPGLSTRFSTRLDFTNPRQSPGLSEKDAAERLARDGPNALTPPKETSELVKYFSHYADPFMLLLILSGTLSCIAYGIDKSQQINLWIGIVLYVVVVLSSSFAYVQSGKASAVMKAFKNMLPKLCHVVRDGRVQDIPAINLVVGDVVRVGGGDQVPADLRLIYCNDLKVEVSSLTGESLPISCTTTSQENQIEEAKNITFNSSQALEGEAVGVVYATGDRTLIGKIARLASATTTVDTTLQREVKGFVKKLTVFSFIMGLVFFFIGLGRGQNAISAFINGFIVVMIANVPEGLPVTVVTILTITGRRLAALNVFVKQLSSVETLGSATVIASDKTGTLTQNKMTVSRLWFDLTPMTTETIYRDLGPSTLTMNPNSVNKTVYSGTATLRALERVCAVCSRTRFSDHRDLTDDEARMVEQNQTLRQLDPSMTLRSAKAAFPQFLSMLDSNMTINSAKRQALTGVRDDSKREVIGDASETALFNFIRARQSIELVRYHNRIVFDVPFNSRNKYALSIMKPYNIPGNTDYRRVLLMKGAPEIILERCNRWMNRGKLQDIDDEFKEQFQLAYETFGGFGERVLGFAQIELDEKEYPADMDNKYNQKVSYSSHVRKLCNTAHRLTVSTHSVDCSIVLCFV